MEDLSLVTTWVMYMNLPFKYILNPYWGQFNETFLLFTNVNSGPSLLHTYKKKVSPLALLRVLNDDY